MAPSPDSRKLLDPFLSLKYVTNAADQTLWHSGLEGPPSGKRLRSLANIRETSEGVRFLGSALVSLWGRRDRAARRWRRHIVQHLRRRTGQLEIEVRNLRRQFGARPDRETLPPEVRQLWESIAALLPIVRQQIGVRPPRATARNIHDAAKSVCGALDAAVEDEEKGTSLARQLALVEEWAKKNQGSEAPDIAQVWARAIARDWQRYGTARRAIPIDPRTKEALVLQVLPSVVSSAGSPCRVRVKQKYIRRVSRLDKDGRDILIKPKVDLPMALLILWIKTQSITAAERMLADPPRLLEAPGATAYDTEEGERSVGRSLAARWSGKDTADDEEHDREPLGAADNTLALASALAPHYKFLSPAQQLLLRTWVELPTSERTLRETARRVGISYANAKVQWAKLWKTLEAHGLKRPRLPLRKWLAI